MLCDISICGCQTCVGMDLKLQINVMILLQKECTIQMMHIKEIYAEVIIRYLYIVIMLLPDFYKYWQKVICNPKCQLCILVTLATVSKNCVTFSGFGRHI